MSQPPRYKTVFDVPAAAMPGYRAVLLHMTEIGMAIVRHVEPGLDDRIAPPLLDRARAYEHGANAVLLTIRMCQALAERRRAGSRPVRPRRRDPEDAALERPISVLFAEICIDLAAAATLVSVPPWVDETPERLRTLIVALVQREAARLAAAGSLVPFAADILAYRPGAARRKRPTRTPDENA